MSSLLSGHVCIDSTGISAFEGSCCMGGLFRLEWKNDLVCPRNSLNVFLTLLSVVLSRNMHYAVGPSEVQEIDVRSQEQGQVRCLRCHQADRERKMEQRVAHDRPHYDIAQPQ